jgi:hypothetical protein
MAKTKILFTYKREHYARFFFLLDDSLEASNFPLTDSRSPFEDILCDFPHVMIKHCLPKRILGIAKNTTQQTKKN